MPTRALALEHARRLVARDHPRLQMSLLLALAGLAGFVASFTLLGMGVTSMAVRYPLAVLLAYATFLGLLWLWIRRWRARATGDDARSLLLDATDAADAASVAIDVASSLGGGGVRAPSFGGGGGFQGGGAGRSWSGGKGGGSADDAPAPPVMLPAASPPPTSGSGGGGGLDLDLDDGAALLLLAAAVLGAVLAAGWVLYAAPALFAELLVDGAVVGALYRRLRHTDRRHWLRAALRKTAVPALVTALLFAAAGAALQVAAPGAVSIGRALERIAAPE